MRQTLAPLPVPTQRTGVHRRCIRKQRGVVLFIALIVLVAMTLAGIAIMRSVDTNNVVAGNLAFKESTLASADNGIAAAFQWLTTTVNNSATAAQLEGDVPAQGYYAVVNDPSDWTDPSVWTAALSLGNDSAGNTVDYIIQRMCTGSGLYSTVQCATTKTGNGGAGTSGNSQGVGGNQFNSPPIVYYRVTVRVQGPRETLSIVQANVGLQQ